MKNYKKYNVNLTEEEIKKLEEIYSDRLSIYKERWKKIYIDGEKTNFKISNHGRIYNGDTDKYIAQLDDTRYLKSNLRYKDKVYTFRLHRLVATYFCKIPKRHLENGLSYNDLVPNHKDGIRCHNAAFNLEWVSQHENSIHAWENGLCKNSQGEKSHLSSIKEKDAIEICELISEGNSNSEILNYLHEHDKLYITKKHIQHIRSGETWRHISKNYNFLKLGQSIPYSMDDNKIHEICKLLEKHQYTDPEIAQITNVSREYVKDIRRGKRRKDISSTYNIDKRPVCKISINSIKRCCELLSDKDHKYSQKEIGNMCGISQCLVSEIFNRKKFIDISKDYDF